VAAIAASVVAVSAFAGCGGGASSTPTTAPPSFAVALGAGVAALKAGNANAAQQLFTEAVAREPTNADALYDLGVAYQDEGQSRNALRAYARALQHAPDDTRVEFNRAVIYSTTDVPLAIFLYRRVISLRPDSPTAYLNLGLLEAATHVTSAPADLSKAVQLDPSLAARIPSAVRATMPGPSPAPGATSGGSSGSTAAG
jgi:Flp pilus assembly protein TadD